MIKIISVALIGVITVNLVRQLRQEYAVPLTMAVAVTMLALILPDVQKIYVSFRDLLSEIQLSDRVFTDAAKICMIGYASKFTCSICDDYGHKSISDKVDIASKIAVCGITLPWVYNLMVNINKLL